MTTKDKKNIKDSERYLRQQWLTPREASIVLGCTEGEVDTTILALARMHNIKSNNKLYPAVYPVGRFVTDFVRTVVNCGNNRTYYDGGSLRTFLNKCGI